jgi:hypothetical protein
MKPASPDFRWNLVQPSVRKITQADLDRGAAISAAFEAKANASRQRLALILDDDAEDDLIAD